LSKLFYLDPLNIFSYTPFLQAPNALTEWVSAFVKRSASGVSADGKIQSFEARASWECIRKTSLSSKSVRMARLCSRELRSALTICEVQGVRLKAHGKAIIQMKPSYSLRL